MRRAWVGLVLALGAATSLAQPPEDTRFDSGPELGARLLRNVVRIRALDMAEHGFGVVVAARGREVLVATARHVVVPEPGAEPADFDPAKRRIELSFCAAADAPPAAIGASASAPSPGPAQAATLEPAFNAAGQDIALLRVQRPAAYEPLARAVALPATLAPRQETWLLGQEQQCGLAPRSGALAALADAQGRLRVEFPGVRGGASGGPALSGYGLIGLVTNSDDETMTVLSLATLEARVRAFAADAWQLVDARNIPPGDPLGARVDLSETLNRYLFAARNLQGLLLLPDIPQPQFVAMATDYNNAVMQRYMPAKERHDGTLVRYWPAPVFAQWQALRDRLWAIHEVFRGLNAGDSKAIFDHKRAPPAVQDRMRALEPELVQLQTGIADFLLALAQGSKS